MQYGGSSFVTTDPAPTITPSFSITPQVTSEPSTGIASGTNLPLLIGIAAVGLIAYGWVSKKR